MHRRALRRYVHRDFGRLKEQARRGEQGENEIDAMRPTISDNDDEIVGTMGTYSHYRHLTEGRWWSLEESATNVKEARRHCTRT